MPSSKKLLLIEDNPRIRGKLDSLLQPYVGQVILASSGLEGLIAYNQHLPHLIVLEQFLGDISGEELLLRWRRELSVKELPILMMTSARFGQLLPTTQARLNGVLAKPLQSKVFIQQILQTFQLVGHLSNPRPLMQFYNPSSFYLLKGDLSNLAFPHLLMDIQHKQLSGVLSVFLPEGERRIILSEGRIVYAESLIPSEGFPALLQKRFSHLFNLKSIEQFFVGSGGRAILQYEVILKSGLLSSTELYSTFQYYIREITTRCFFLRHGSYSFVDDVAYVKRSAQQPLELLLLLFEGIRRYYTNHELLQEFAAYQQYQFKLAPDYKTRIQVMIKQFPQFSFAPQRIENRTLQECLTRFSPNPELNSQILKTLLLGKLLFLVPVNSQHQNSSYNEVNWAQPARQFSFSEPSLPSFQYNEPPQFSSGQFPAMPPLQDRTTSEHSDPKERYTRPTNQVFPNTNRYPNHFRQTQERPITQRDHSSSSYKEFSEDAFQGNGPTIRITSEQPIIMRHDQQPNRTTQERVAAYSTSSSVLPAVSSSDEQGESRLAQKYYTLGHQSLKALNYPEAIRHFQNAVRVEPQEPHYLLYLGWSVYRSANGNPNLINQGKQYIQKVIQQKTNFRKAYYFLALIHKMQGELKEAEALFRHLHSLDPQNKEILQHLREIAQMK